MWPGGSGNQGSGPDPAAHLLNDFGQVTRLCPSGSPSVNSAGQTPARSPFRRVKHLVFRRPSSPLPTWPSSLVTARFGKETGSKLSFIPFYWYVPTNNHSKISTEMSRATLANWGIDQNQAAASQDDRGARVRVGGLDTILSGSQTLN